MQPSRYSTCGMAMRTWSPVHIVWGLHLPHGTQFIAMLNLWTRNAVLTAAWLQLWEISFVLCTRSPLFSPLPPQCLPTVASLVSLNNGEEYKVSLSYRIWRSPTDFEQTLCHGNQLDHVVSRVKFKGANFDESLCKVRIFMPPTSP